MERRTKIVITLGPACSEDATLERLFRAGVNVVRLNFSHGSHEEHAARVDAVRKTAARLNHPISLLQDLQGPKIRTMEIEGGAVELEQGQSLILTVKEVLGNRERVSVDFPDLPSSVQPGGKILVDDGQLELVVVSIIDDEVHTKVILGGELKPNKGINLPGVHLNVPPLTQKDEEDLAFGLSLGIDYVAMSFVRTANDIAVLRQLIGRLSPKQKHTPIIAKIERPEAIENLDEIIKITDGVMVARGDLGVEMPPEVVPVVQKKIIASANKHCKVVITATQMLDSMIHNPRPTRAEATDVANAIFDGTDAVMLSGETAVGKYPLQAVEIMDAIIKEAESHLGEWGHWSGAILDDLPVISGFEGGGHDDALSITRAAKELAHDRNVTAIAVFTQSGRTAVLMSKSRPAVPILGFTPEVETYNRLAMLWGVVPYLVPYADTVEEMLLEVEKAIITATPIQVGQQVVLISGFPVGALSLPNMALLHTVGNIIKDKAGK